MKNKIELLAPAGNREALHAAVENGADAVYLGGRLFNARQQADNFDMETLEEELGYAHARDVSIYLTLNTLLRDDEIEQGVAYATEAYNAGIDGIIVQDIGLARALHTKLPKLPLHGSTQMTIFDLEGALALEDMGFQRVVLARELTLEQAALIAHNTRLEVEMFIHGALCVSYSGQCLMSSMIGGRSGNRGRCAQPCRLPYSLIGNGSDRGGKTKHSGYLLSPKDICSLEHLGEIVVSGISSLKIEGRMKSPEYVATVVRIYRRYLDKALEQLDRGMGTKLVVNEKDRHDLLQIFNRGGFSSGYLLGKSGSDMMTYEKPNNSGTFLGTTASYDRRKLTISVRLEDRLSVGDGVEIWTGGSDSPGGTVSIIRVGEKSVKTASKGDFAEIGYFKGSIGGPGKLFKTTDVELNTIARESYGSRNVKRIAIKGNVVFKLGLPLTLIVTDGDGRRVSAKGTVLPEAAVSRPLTEERLIEQIQKTGSTPFAFTELTVDAEDDLTVPISEVNVVRRQALDALYNERAERYAQRRISNGRISNVGFDDNTPSDIEKPASSVQATSNAQPTGSVQTNGERADSDFLQETKPYSKDSSSGPRISLYFYRWRRDVELASLGADRLYLPVSAHEQSQCAEAIKAARNTGVEVFYWLPTITSGNYEKIVDRFLKKHIEEGKSNGDGEIWINAGEQEIDGVMVANIGMLRRLSRIHSIRLAGDVPLNLFNANSIHEAAGYGIESAAISHEVTVQQIYEMLRRLKSIARGSSGDGEARSYRPDVEAAVYGRLALMTSEYCPVGSVEGGFTASQRCSGCCSKEAYTLEDRLGMRFPVLCDSINCTTTILNSNVLFVPDAIESLVKAGISIFRLNIWDEAPDTIKDLIELYRASALGNVSKRAAFGGLVDRIKATGFTKGHYYRGV